MSRIGVTAVALLCLGALVTAQDEGDVRRRVEDLIGKLGSDDFEVREKATAELKKIGTPALEPLRKAAESEDAEVRSRARAILRHIEDAAKPKRRPERDPDAWRRFRGSSTIVQSDAEGTTYRISPTEGAPISFRKNSDGSVALTHTDEDGKSRTVRSESLEKFLKDHKELAEEYGITREGISYAGARVSFKTGIRGFRRIPRERPPKGEQEEDPFEGMNERIRELLEEFEKQRELFREWRLPSRRAFLGPVPEVLRAHVDIPEGVGVVVERVPKGSVEEKLGIRRHDVLLEVDGKAVRGFLDARAITEKSTVTLLRGGKRMTVTPGSGKKKEEGAPKKEGGEKKEDRR